MERLRKITIHEDGEVDYFFDGSDEPFVPWEFSENSPTRKYLMDIHHAIKAEIPKRQESLF